MNTMPGFTADSSVATTTRTYRRRTSPAALPMPNAVTGQARIRIGGGALGGLGGGVFALDPRPPECTECQWTCTIVSCGPGCRREECRDECTSVPCAVA
jgi:hypothetical protein